MKYATSILIILALISCKQKAKQNNTAESKKVTFDSTNYFQLREAYEKKDTLMLGHFFSEWFEASKKTHNQEEVLISRALYGIFSEIYHPFKLEKYGWLARSHYSKYKYAILPIEIAYKVVDEISNPDEIYSKNLDTLTPFLPKPNLGNAKILYDIHPFNKSLELFLETESFQRSFFLDTTSFINMPISYDWKGYRTTPEIYGILIDKQLKNAVADIRLIDTGLRIKLVSENNKWKIKEIETLWIE